MNEALRIALRHGPDCPALEDLIERPTAFEAHLRNCEACEAELALYHSFETPAEGTDEREALDYIIGRLQGKARAKKTGFRPGFFTPAWLGGAAVAVAAVLFGVGLATHPRLPGAGATVEDRTVRGAAIPIISPTGDLSEVPSVFEWRAVEGARDYVVTLREVDNTEIFHKNVTSTRILLPPEVRKLLVPGRKLLLQVTARNEAGGEAAGSGTVSLRIVH